jgi:hypothetical protein
LSRDIRASDATSESEHSAKSMGHARRVVNKKSDQKQGKGDMGFMIAGW